MSLGAIVGAIAGAVLALFGALFGWRREARKRREAEAVAELRRQRAVIERAHGAAIEMAADTERRKRRELDEERETLTEATRDRLGDIASGTVEETVSAWEEAQGRGSEEP